MAFIVLTKAEAEALRGKTGDFTALDPQEMKDGTFILPAAVLTDPAHAKVLGDRKRESRVDVFAMATRPIDKAEMKAADEIDPDIKPDPDVKPDPIDPDLKPGAKA